MQIFAPSSTQCAEFSYTKVQDVVTNSTAKMNVEEGEL